MNFLRKITLSLAAAALLIPAAVAQQNTGKTKVACVGNSITYGFLVEDRENNNYPTQLGRMLGDQYEVGNFGKSGATLLKKGHRPYNEQEEFQQALDFKPDVVLIHLGVNDTDPRDWPDYGDEFVTDYVALIDSFKAVNPDVRVILANLTPLLSTHFRFRSGTMVWRDYIRQQIPIVAEITGSELIDFGTAMRDKPNLLPEGIHPNAEGAKLLAETAYKAITGDYGGLQLPEVYGDRMVLQRYQPLTINGTADAGDKVTVTLGGHTASAVANNRGEWSVTLPPMKEDTGLSMTVTDGKKTLKFSDIAVGEVWVASGQSNMEFQLRNTTTFADDKALLDDPLLRFFDMKPVALTNPPEWTDEQKNLTDDLKHYLPSQWTESSEETSPRFSAVAWYFGKMLRDSLNVPVGIISNAIGGSTTESWVDIETLEHGMPEVLVQWHKNDYVQPWAQERALQNTGEKSDVRKTVHRHPYEPSYLFAAGIRPLGAYPVAGAIWYQGESNAHNIEVHEGLFRLLVDSWRNYWNQPEMPFYFVQLSSLNRPSWPTFRDSQRRLAESIQGTAMALSLDHGDSLDVHPRNKRPVGERLARQALNRVYSMNNVTPQGPTIVKAEQTAPGTLILTFDYADGLTTSDGAAPRTFEMAQYEGYYLPAETVEILDNNTIKLTNMSIENPRLVRYGWQPFTRANLVNSDGLPTSTFKVSVTETPVKEEGIDAGISAPFTGMADGRVIRAGGCNFPVNPMAPGSQKKFYQGIYALTSTPDGEITTDEIGLLPFPTAYGVGVTTPQGLVMVGGTTPSEALSTVFLLNVNEDGKAVLTQLPSLPYSVDNTSGAYLDGKVYVAGGSVNGKPSNDLYCLDMTNTEKGWTKLPSFPGNPRVQPVLAGSKDAKGTPTLYMWGGFAGKGEGRDASLDTDGYAYNPAKKKWSKIEGPKNAQGEDVSTGGGVAATLPDGKIVVTGGVNKDIFLEALRNQAPDYLSHPIEWYKFNDLVLVFDPTTESWSIADQTPAAARAGAGAVVTPEGDVLLIGGELKPRIRTDEVLRIAVK